MGSGLMPYLVDLAALESALGSRDETLIRELCDDNEEHVVELDALFEQNGAPGIREALRELIEGESLHDACGGQYHYAFELLCQRFGTLLDNDAWYPCGWSFVEELDRKLASQGLLMSIRRVLHRGPPVALPPPRDFPAVGYLAPDASKSAHLELSCVPRQLLDIDEWAALRELMSWLTQAVIRVQTLVLYYY